MPDGQEVPPELSHQMPAKRITSSLGFLEPAPFLLLSLPLLPGLVSALPLSPLPLLDLHPFREASPKAIGGTRATPSCHSAANERRQFGPPLPTQLAAQLLCHSSLGLSQSGSFKIRDDGRDQLIEVAVLFGLPFSPVRDQAVNEFLGRELALI